MKVFYIFAIGFAALIGNGLLSFASASTASETAGSSATLQVSKSNQADKIKHDTEAQEIIILRVQLAEMQKFQEQILTTVYWSLGALGTVAALLVGFGWWTNLRVYERDKQSLERELRSILLDGVRQSKEEQQKSVVDQFDELRKILNAEIASRESQISINTRTLTEAIEKKILTQVSQIKSSCDQLKNNVRELNLASHLQERLRERDQDSYRNALQSAVTALELANQIGDEYSVGEVLDLVAEDIAAILKGRHDLPIDNFLIGQLVETLDAVKGSHAHAAAALKSKVPGLVSG